MLMMLVLPLVWPADAHARSGALFVLVWPGPGQLMLMMLFLQLVWPADAHARIAFFLFVLVWPGPGQLMFMMLVFAFSLTQFGHGLAS